MEEEKEEEEEKEKAGRRHPGLLPGREKEEGGQLVEQESTGCKGYTEGTNCSGVRRGVLPAHILPTHTRSQTHTHAHTPPGLALSV